MARAVSYVPQEHGMPFPYRVKDIVLMGRTPYMNRIGNLPRSEHVRALEALDRLGMADLAEITFHRLSGGQRQMVLIARALAQDTPVILLDEPASNLDFKNQIIVWRVMKQLARSGLTVVVCTHDPNHVLWFCDAVLVINQGQIVAHGDPGSVMTQSTLNALYPGISSMHHFGDMAMVTPLRD